MMSSAINTLKTYRSVSIRWNDIVKSGPSRPALTIGQRTLTYGELDQQIDRIADALMTHLPESGHPVGFMFGIGWQPVAAIFGILKAGHIYVPMDIHIPAHRLQRIIDHAGIQAILIDDETADLNLIPDHVHTINVDHLPHVEPVSGPDYVDGAYLVYTSGSTGEPKGVLHNHANILKYTDLDTGLFSLSSDTKGAHFFHYGFAAARTMTFNILLNGGHLHLYDVRREGFQDMGAWLKRHELDMIQLTPTLIREMVKDVSDKVSLPELSYVLITSEPLRRVDIEQFRQKVDTDCVIVNRLASSEGGAVAEYWIQPDTVLDQSFVPIGYPLDDFNQVAVLDEQGNPVPEGQYGELTITGQYIFMGYWAKQTRSGHGLERDPEHPERRIYRSGDLAEVQQGGRLHYVGRRDSVLKIRGIRVDIGEVEEAILAHPAIEDVAVIVPRDTADTLAGFYTLSQPLTSHALRQYLSDRLQQHMIPSRLLAIPNIPLTATGKVDLGALKQIVVDHSARRDISAANLEEPRSGMEQAIARIWKSTLKLRHIGRHENFFDLGGSSLDAFRIMARIQKEMGINIPLALLITHGSVAEFAHAIQDSHRLAKNWSPLVPLKVSGSRLPLYIVHGIGGNIVELSQFASFIDADQPVYGIQSHGLDGESEPLDDVQQMATRYIEAIQNHQPEGPYYLSGYSLGGVVAFEMARQLAIQGHNIGALILFDTASKQDHEKYHNRVSRTWISVRTQRILKQVVFSPFDLLRMPRHRWSSFLSRKRFQLWRAFQSIKLDRRTPPLTAEMRRIRIAHFSALEHYQLESYPGRGIFINATQSELGHRRVKDNRAQWWMDHMHGGMMQFVVEGTHSSIISDPAVTRQVAEFVSVELEKAQHPENYSLQVAQTF